MAFEREPCGRREVFPSGETACEERTGRTVGLDNQLIDPSRTSQSPQHKQAVFVGLVNQLIDLAYKQILAKLIARQAPIIEIVMNSNTNYLNSTE